MDNKLKEWINKGLYLPGQLRERVDQDTVLAMVNEVCTDILPPEFWSRTNAEALKAYTLDAFLAFMAAHGYVLRPSRRALPFHNLEVTSGAFKDGSLAQVVPPMDAKLALWRKNLKHVPAILVDFHDLKDVFKAMHAVWLPGLSGPATTIGVMDGTCYIFDCFLWVMARHGLVLQRSHAKQKFGDLYQLKDEVARTQRASFMAILRAGNTST